MTLDDSMRHAPIAAVAIGLPVAVGSILVGLRGRRVGDHPYCRRCGFDLVGKPDSSVVCAECGVDLHAPRAIVVGVCRRRVEMIVAGVVALVLWLAGAATFARDGFDWAQRYDWRRHWPESCLVADLRGNDPRARDLAFAQLTRPGLFRTSREAASALVDEGFKGSLRGAGFDAGDAARLARDHWSRDEIDEATVRRAMQSTLALDLTVAPKAARGHVLRYRVTSPEPSLTLAPSPTFHARADALDGRPLGRPTWSILDPSAGIAALGDTLPLDASIPPGPAMLTTTLTVATTLTVPGRPTLTETRDLVLTSSTTIVDADAMRCPAFNVYNGGTRLAPTTIPIGPADVVRVTLIRGPRRGTFRFDGGQILADVTLASTRADVAGGEVGGEVVRSLGTIFVTGFLSGRHRDASLTVDDLPAEPYELRLTPAPERGVELFDVTAVFQTPIVIRSTAIRVELPR